jgi:selenide,water dikinase
MDKNMVKLTQYSHGAGCGCKISPSVLTEILKTGIESLVDKKLIVGNETRDDAAVYDIGNGMGIISTTDFFMPIVDDPFTFGRIAAVNAISDVYAMGGKPLMAIAVLGWPVDKLSVEIAARVVDGGRQACKEAGIILAGGHSIDSPEPIFGLAVTGIVDLKKLKRNDTAQVGCRLYLTKPLGVGILTTAQKAGLLLPEHQNIATEIMSKMNRIGEELAEIEDIKSMTDVTGFGFIGHLSEMCQGSGLSAIVEYKKIPKIDIPKIYLQKSCIPGGNYRNRKSYESLVNLKNDSYKTLLYDPQTSGGLLIAVSENGISETENLLKKHKINYESFGYLTEKQDFLITVL